jgi:hypothetical protein
VPEIKAKIANQHFVKRRAMAALEKQTYFPGAENLELSGLEQF